MYAQFNSAIRTTCNQAMQLGFKCEPTSLGLLASTVAITALTTLCLYNRQNLLTAGIQRENRLLVKAAVWLGADVNRKNKGGKSYLHSIIDSDQNESRMKFFLQLVPSVNVNQTATIYAYKKKFTDSTPLHSATVLGKDSMVKTLVEERVNEIEINRTCKFESQEFSALALCPKSDFLGKGFVSMGHLIDSGLHIEELDIPGPFGDTPFQKVALAGFLDSTVGDQHTGLNEKLLNYFKENADKVDFHRPLSSFFHGEGEGKTVLEQLIAIDYDKVAIRLINFFGDKFALNNLPEKGAALLYLAINNLEKKIQERSNALDASSEDFYSDTPPNLDEKSLYAEIASNPSVTLKKELVLALIKNGAECDAKLLKKLTAIGYEDLIKAAKNQ